MVDRFVFGPGDAVVLVVVEELPGRGEGGEVVVIGPEDRAEEVGQVGALGSRRVGRCCAGGRRGCVRRLRRRGW